MAVASDVPVPPQMPVPATYDFRNAMTAPKGHKDRRKRKLDDYAELVGLAQPACLAPESGRSRRHCGGASGIHRHHRRTFERQAGTGHCAGGTGRGRSCDAG